MRYLLDTNAWIRLFHRPGELSRDAREALFAETSVALSGISLWEVAQLHANGRIKLPVSLPDWLRSSLPERRVIILPLTPEIVVQAYTFTPDLHGDPADRLIAATALSHDLTLVTSDQKLLAHPGIPTLSTR